ncbi:MAG: GPW/gp25 family protein [Flavobacteriales bacterium]|nr:GPW/gp25 family protein [Flavobacteriales bacterium]
MGTNVFLKTGWSFLPRIVSDGERICQLEYHEDIWESLQILFTTLPGERLAHPLYGCDLMQYTFRPINNSLISEMHNTILTAITLYETRIEVIDIDIAKHSSELHRLDITIGYLLRSTSSRYNYTIPFYTMED